jgi:hypothetical protein
LLLFATGVIDTSGKFDAIFVNTGGKFATGINDTMTMTHRKFSDIFAAQGTPPMSLTPVANGKNLQSEK